MRIQYYQQVQDQLIDDYPQIAYLRPFKPNEIYTFLTRWPFNEHQERNITRIYADLTDRPTLRAMCSNPLVLAMYVANDQTLAPGEVPESRTEFYRSVVNELLVLRRRRQDLVRGPSRALREQREEILGELAYRNLIDATQPANSLAWVDALKIAMRVWGINEPEAEARFRTLETETGIIAEERISESFQFIHLTFCEFLAAVECASNQKRWRELLKAYQDFALSSESNLVGRLIEVIPFALASMTRAERPRALNEITSLDDREVLGRCFLETQLYDHEEWSNYVSAETEYLTREGISHRDEKWLRRLHLFSVVLRDARSWMDQVAGRPVGPELDGLLPSIIGSNREALEEVFSLYASQDAPAAFRLAESVGVDMLDDYRSILISSCQEPPFLALAMERAWGAAASRNTWLIILAEAALRYRNVAHKLRGSQIPNDVPSAVMPVPASVFVRGIKARSCYGDCLAFSLSIPPESLHQEFRAVNIISKLPVPSWFQKIMSSRTGFIFLATLSLVIAFSGTYAANHIFVHNSIPNITVITLSYVFGITPYLLSLASVFFQYYYQALIAALFNIWYNEKTLGRVLRARSARRFINLFYRSGPGRWIGKFLAGPEQLALYKIAVLRGGIEISSARRSGYAMTDGDLLPTKKLRLWSNGPQAG
jgi:hypothetical protein